MTDNVSAHSDAPIGFFPLFIDLRGKRALVVGGGAVGMRRVETLLRFGARVTLISPELRVAELAARAGVCWLCRNYAAGDAAGHVLVVAATDDREVNRLIGEEARAAGIPVSVADRAGECSFRFPAVCATETLVAGVTSLDGDHSRVKAVAGKIRELLRDCSG